MTRLGVSIGIYGVRYPSPLILRRAQHERLILRRAQHERTPPPAHTSTGSARAAPLPPAHTSILYKRTLQADGPLSAGSRRSGSSTGAWSTCDSTSGLSHPWIWRTSQSGLGELRRCKGSLTEVWGLPTIVRQLKLARQRSDWVLPKEKGRVEQRRAKANIPVIL